ncbi:MAG: DUF971 domain-containing protein [Gammaproteobacteria bacterium]|nr:DUF971 domain-containing protein [Gammaproteobacteria bacterium]MDH5344183.1 DUF971 domain-containing protein [Gammaproteobacteria bacterium]
MERSPTDIKIRTKSRILEISFNDGSHFELPFEYLRVMSPSAEVRGHGPGQEVLQKGKEDISVRGVEPMGHYALRILFDDGHDTGLYTWNYLYELGADYDRRWRDYLDRLSAAGYARQPK